MSGDNEILYQERSDRIQNAINLEPVDRIPMIFMGVGFAPRYLGVSIADFCADPEATVNANLDAMDKLGGWDGINMAGAGRITPLLTALWLSRIGVPGRDLPPDSLWQVREAEVMTTDDYDFIIKKGWQLFLENYMPRVIDMAEFGEAVSWVMGNITRCVGTYRDRGYVPVCGTLGAVPYEYLCGARSMQKFMVDLYRMPDKVQAAMDACFPDIIGQTIGIAKATGVSGVWLGGWRSASALLAPKLWDRFVWPYTVKFIDELIAAGLMPVLHWDQDWTRDLARLQELPAKKCLMNPDGMTDMRKFKELAGDRMAMMGDVPSNLLVAGTPEDVRNYVRDLVSLFGSTGLLLCPGCDAPINTKPENMEAFVAASREFGVV
jgi:uroporphyrinogen-III decarboxylase